MDLIIQKSSPTPIYQQIYDQVLTQILKKQLSPDDCLPSIRLVARELNISVISVKNAYETLEQDGYIYSIQGKGFFVARLYSPEDIHAGLIKEAVDWVHNFCQNYHIKVDEIIAKLREDDPK